MKIRAAARAVSHRSAPNLRKHPAQKRIVIADHHHAVKRNTIHEIQKCLLHLAHVAIAVHVLAIDICDHGKNRGQL